MQYRVQINCGFLSKFNNNILLVCLPKEVQVAILHFFPPPLSSPLRQLKCMFVIFLKRFLKKHRYRASSLATVSHTTFPCSCFW